MLEEGARVAAAPECRFGPGWIYHDGFCYIISNYHAHFDEAQSLCGDQGAYLADVLTQAEGDWLKGVLGALNPQDGTDYFIGGTDMDGDGAMIWLSGNKECRLTQQTAEKPIGLQLLCTERTS